ncbi:alpha/beta hydrolase [Nocardia sp. CA-120079]|uniref:alpha/beta hydrolase n=1 Tax=Nocardia sp. CA-120079 TaxID=3239974 RepID=UPI003D960969
MDKGVVIHIPVGGSELHAWWYPPEGVTGRAPCVVLAHGFGAVKTMRLWAYAKRFAAAGIGALVFDYRHFGESSGELRNLVDLRKQFADWNAAIAAARSLPEVDPDRVAVWGSSMSGGMVVVVAAHDPRIAAVVAQAPFADGRVSLAHMPFSHSLWLFAAGLRDAAGALVGATPYKVRAAGRPGDRQAVLASADAYDGMLRMIPEGETFENEVAARVALRLGWFRPIKFASRVRCPLLVQVMDHDVVTPPGPAAAMAATAPQGKLLGYSGGHFDPYVGATFEQVVPDQIAFLADALQSTTGDGNGPR